MSRLIRIFFFLLAVTIVSRDAFALVLHTQSFNSTGYSSWTSAGATHTYLPTGGWDGNGAAQFTTPTSADGYSGYSTTFTSSPAIYIRWVIKKSANFCSTNSNALGKALIVRGLPVSDGNRAIIIDHNCAGNWTDFFVCPNIECDYRPTQPGCVFSYTCTTRKYNWCEADGKWVSVEVFISSGQAQKTWVTYRDGTKVDFLTTRDECSNYNIMPSVTGWNEINILGTYGSVGSGSFILDDLVISTTKIGPPAGFVSGSVIKLPATPGGFSGP